MTNKLKIDINNGVLEVEGEKEFVDTVYKDFKDSLIFKNRESVGGLEQKKIEPPEHGEKKKLPTKAPKTKGATKAKNGKKRESFNIIEGLNVRPKTGEGLLDLWNKKKPKTVYEKNTVIVYYLKTVLKETKVTPDHIYTAYKGIGIKVPGALTQSLRDTSSRKGFISTSDINNITLNVIGENLVEHDLPGKTETTE